MGNRSSEEASEGREDSSDLEEAKVLLKLSVRIGEG
jgi:hypothetical protein